MPKPEFKPGYLCINHPGRNVESFAVVGGAAYMFYEEDGTQKLAIEDGTDWVDFEDSELIGGSETLITVWGIPIKKTKSKMEFHNLLRPLFPACHQMVTQSSLGFSQPLGTVLEKSRSNFPVKSVSD